MPNSRGIYMGSTKIDPNETIGQISRLLVKAGATRTTTDYGDGRVLAVRFTLPTTDGPVSFRLPCRIEKLTKALGNEAQAERTAWRQVLRWIEAQMAMIDIAMVQAQEVFMPYATTGDGNTTMFEAWQGQLQLAAAEEPGKLVAVKARK